jgi:hypothetical protein
MAYRFVPSYHDLGRAMGPRLAVVWHMAEGGGTVAFLAKDNRHGVSVHFVIGRDGSITQMLQLSHMHSSINPRDIRTTDDPDGFYGTTAARAVMGDYWWRNPNHASIGVEVEGFAAEGPNAAQRDACDDLWVHLRLRYPSIRSLGHRDFADYKACPGRKFPWDRVGGHGPAPEDDPLGPTFETTATIGRATVKLDGVHLIATSDGQFHPVVKGYVRNVSAVVRISDGPYDGETAYLVPVPSGAQESGLLLAAHADYVPLEPPPPAPATVTYRLEIEGQPVAEGSVTTT